MKIEAVQNPPQSHVQVALLPQQGICSKRHCNSVFNTVFDAFFSFLKAPERAPEWIVQKIADRGIARGFGVREAKLALALTSLGIVGEFGLQIVNLAINVNNFGMRFFFPGRFCCLEMAIISAVMCLPLSGRLSYCDPFDQIIKADPKFLLRIAQITTLVTCIQIAHLMDLRTKMPLSSPADISYLVATGLINISNLLLTAGISKLIKHVNSNSYTAIPSFDGSSIV